ncbi:MAG: M20/M25/M40 family metallo-hydrolase [Candidatus Aminicenantales bacterium]
MKRHFGVLLIAAGVVGWTTLPAQNRFLKDLPTIVQEYRKSHEHEILQEFLNLLSIPNVSADRMNIRRNAEFIRDLMAKRGIAARLIETQGNPVVFGELRVPNAEKTLMFYVHYDGQPVDPSKWTDSQPFEPVLRPGKLEAGSDAPKPISSPAKGEPFDEDWRIYARGSSDDRAPIVAILSAIDAFRSSGRPIGHNLKFIIEGEEEAGSPNLRPFLEQHKEMLKSDILFMCDGPGYYSSDPTLFFGVRGITSIEITVYGPNTSLHSGHYGNWAPNPATRLARLLASMQDDEGKVLIAGFYDTVIPLTDIERDALKNIPPYDGEIMELYGFSKPESVGQSLLEAIQYPSLNVNGVQSGWIGPQARTIIPDRAVASIDIRLVKGNDKRAMVQKAVDHIRNQGYHIVDKDPDGETRKAFPFIAKVVTSEKGYNASRTSMDIPISKRVIRALTNYWDRSPVLLPSLGGSLPLYMFDETLGVPIIGVPIANHDNNQHQPNENIRIGHLWKGIETFAALMTL